MCLVESSNAEVSGASEVPQYCQIYLLASQAAVFLLENRSCSSKIVSIEINRNTKVQVITNTKEWFPVKIQNIVGTNWLYSHKTQTRLYIAIVRELSNFC